MAVMDPKKKDVKAYDLEGDEPDEQAEAGSAPPPAETSATPEARPRSGARALDVCPNCASPLASADAVVCMRCGYDLKSLKVIKTATGGTAAPPPPEPATETTEPLCGPGAGDMWLPAVMAISSLLVLTFGYLSGWGGLFAGEDAVSFGERVAGLFKMAARTAVWTVAGSGALFVVANILKRPVGDLRLGVTRLLAIVCAVSLISVIDFGPPALELTLQLTLQAGGFVGLAIALSRLQPRDAATLLGITVMHVVVLALVAALIIWAAPPLS